MSSSTTSNAAGGPKPLVALRVVDGMGPSAALPRLDDGPASPAPWRLASGPMATTTRPSRLLPRAARPHVRPESHPTAANHPLPLAWHLRRPNPGNWAASRNRLLRIRDTLDLNAKKPHASATRLEKATCPCQSCSRALCPLPAFAIYRLATARAIVFSKTEASCFRTPSSYPSSRRGGLLGTTPESLRRSRIGPAKAPQYSRPPSSDAA